MMQTLGKVSLFLVLLAFSILLSPNYPAFDGLFLAWSNEVRKFGTEGENGTDGQNGLEGQHTDSLTIFTDGSPMTIDLSGEDGFPGENGGDGNNAICEPQPENIDSHLQGMSGGNGGNGGNGGDGGNGGSLTVYYTNLEDLQQIYVISAGGKGGSAGVGGNGGEGCQCSNPFWVVETCKGDPGTPNYFCTTSEYSCTDGANGRVGTDGRSGRDGVPGTLTLIERSQPLPPDQLTATVTMQTLKDRGFVLSRNIWETKTGAVSLFAPGSVIGDRYRELVERFENSFLLVWNAPQSFAPFANKTFNLALKDEGGIDFSPAGDVWLQAKTTENNNITQLVVYNAILASEATKLESTGLVGRGTNLQLNLVDVAGQSNLIATEFYVKYRITTSDSRFRAVYDYTLKYEGNIPPNLIEYNENSFTLSLGQLPIDPKYLQPGVGVEIELLATRSFADNSTEQKIIVQQIIGK